MDKTTLARVVLVSAIAVGTGLLGYFLHPAPAPQRSVKCPTGYTLNSANTCESTSPPSNSGGPPSGTQPPPMTDDDDHGHGHDPDDHVHHDNGHHYGQEKNGSHGHHYGQQKHTDRDEEENS